VARPRLYPVILAGGRGTRFWPRSRKRLAKQVLALTGERTMIQETVARLAPLAPARNFWVITNGALRSVIARQLGKLPRTQILAEPAARNTAPAIGLAAFILERTDPSAVLGLFPADHVISNAKRFRATVARAAAIAAAGENIVVMGLKPTRPETGYGYVEVGARRKGVLGVKRFTEKPDRRKAARFLATGRYYWNAGMFLWSARTLANALREHLPATARHLETIAAAWGAPRFASVYRRLYPKCENISVDYAVLERRSRKGERRSKIYCIPAEFGWSDLGSWAALHEHHARAGVRANVFDAASGLALEAHGNYIHAPGKFVAAVGVEDLVVVETRDALLVTTRGRSQDVGKLVKELERRKLHRLL
jgi:mannose-1-phosphate guanylyltransferase